MQKITADLEVEGVDLQRDPHALKLLVRALASTLDIDPLDVNLELTLSARSASQQLAAEAGVTSRQSIWGVERRSLGGSKLVLSISILNVGDFSAITSILSSDSFTSGLSHALFEQGYNVSIAVQSPPSLSSEMPAGEVWDLDEDGDFRLRACPAGNPGASALLQHGCPFRSVRTV